MSPRPIRLDDLARRRRCGPSTSPWRGYHAVCPAGLERIKATPSLAGSSHPSLPRGGQILSVDSGLHDAAGAQRRPTPATRYPYRGHRAPQPQVRSDLHRPRHARPQEPRSQDQRPPNSIGVSASRKADRTRRPLVRVTAPGRQRPIEPVTSNTITVTSIAAKTHTITTRSATRNQIPYLNNPTPVEEASRCWRDPHPDDHDA